MSKTLGIMGIVPILARYLKRRRMGGVKDMTIREIRNELEKIYKERRSWSGAKGPFTEPVIRLKELILIKQQILYRMEDAKLLKDKREESFNTTLYRIIDNYTINLTSKGNKT